MKRYCKILILIIFTALLAGCGWDDVYNKYKDVLDKSPSCEYKSVSVDKAYMDVDKITLMGDSNGVYVKFNNSKKYDITSNQNVFYDNYTFSFGQFKNQLEDYLDDYKNSGDCPKKLYIGERDSIPSVMYKCDFEECPYEYVYEKPNTGNNNGSTGNQNGNSTGDNSTGNNTAPEEVFDNSCAANRSLACKNFAVRDHYDNIVYIQLGYQKTTNNEILEYFAVSYTEDVINAQPVFYNDTDWSVLASNNPSSGSAYYSIIPSEKDTLFLGNNKFIEELHLEYNDSHLPTYNTGTVMYYLSATPVEGDGFFTGSNSSADVNINTDSSKVELGKVTCETLFQDSNGNPNSTHKLLSTTLKFMQYLGIILAFVLSIIDFIKVVPTQDKDALRKSTIKAVTRFGIAILIFFVPIILDFVLELIGFNSSTCGLL